MNAEYRIDRERVVVIAEIVCPCVIAIQHTSYDSISMLCPWVLHPVANERRVQIPTGMREDGCTYSNTNSLP